MATKSRRSPSTMRRAKADEEPLLACRHLGFRSRRAVTPCLALRRATPHEPRRRQRSPPGSRLQRGRLAADLRRGGPPGASALFPAVLGVVQPSQYSCTSRIATEPSPTADATPPGGAGSNIAHRENARKARSERELLGVRAGRRQAGSSQYEAALVTLELGRQPGRPRRCPDENKDRHRRDLLGRAQRSGFSTRADLKRWSPRAPATSWFSRTATFGDALISRTR
ncbi:MAG: hypothetical protein MZV63_23705 [Marinilabiliales bacterium]|nr:hypothetical protein [Marinilabiliales bacterium]